jgi:hypothetical protein
MLRNPIYKGERIFNRSEWVKDHETGRRRAFDRPRDQWIEQHDEELRIVPEALWQAAQDVTARRRRSDRTTYRRGPDGRMTGTIAGAGHRVRTKTLFGGLLACGECSGPFHTARSADQLACGWHRDRGPEICASTLVVPRRELEDRVLGAVTQRVLTPENVQYAAEQAVGLALRELSDGARPAPAETARLAEIEEEVATLRRVAERRGNAPQVARLIADLEHERRELAACLAASQPLVVDASRLRAMAERWAADLRATLEASVDDCRRAFESLLGGRRMMVYADAGRGFRVEGLFDVPWMQNAPLGGALARGASVVAGVRS